MYSTRSGIRPQLCCVYFTDDLFIARRLNPFGTATMYCFCFICLLCDFRGFQPVQRYYSRLPEPDISSLELFPDGSLHVIWPNVAIVTCNMNLSLSAPTCHVILSAHPDISCGVSDLSWHVIWFRIPKGSRDCRVSDPDQPASLFWWRMWRHSRWRVQL
jgi:hypothetical protein